MFPSGLEFVVLHFKISSVFLCTVLWQSHVLSEVAPVRLTPAYLHEWAEQARESSPSLKSTLAEKTAAARGKEAVRTWSDPVGVVGASFAAKEKRRDDGDTIFGIEQPLPLMGKAEAMRGVAAAEEQRAITVHSARFQQVRFELTRTLLEIALLDEERVVLAEDAGWRRTMARAATELVASPGAGRSAEVLRLEGESASREVEVRKLALVRQELEAQLRAILGSTSTVQVPLLLLPTNQLSFHWTDKLLGLAVRNEPKLALARAESTIARARLLQTQREKRPDVSVALEARASSGRGELREGTALVKVSLPWFQPVKWRALEARDQSRAEAADYERAQREIDARETMRSLEFRVSRAREEARLAATEIIPKVEAAFAAGMAGWEANRGSLYDVMEAKRQWYDARLQTLRAVADEWKALAEVVLCCGMADLESLESAFGAGGTAGGVQ